MVIILNQKMLLKKLHCCENIYQYLITIAGCLCALTSGLLYGWPSPTLPQLLKSDSQIPITTSEGSSLSVVNVLASIISCVLGCVIADKIGRKPTLLLTSPLYIISWLVVAYASTVTMLMSGRFVGGLADGLTFTCLPMYIGEIASAKIRGFLSTVFPLSLSLGAFIINIIGSYFSIKTTALMCLSVPVLHFITFCRAPESPYFLLMKGNRNRARENLSVLRGSTDVENEINALQRTIEEQAKGTARNFELFREKSNRKAVYIIMGLTGVQFLSGLSSLVCYVQIIIQKTGEDVSPVVYSNIFLLINFFMSLIAAVLVDTAGRRPLLILSTLGSCICLAGVGFYFYFQSSITWDIPGIKYIPIAALVLYVVLFSLGLGPIPFIIQGELFPTNVKALACCLSNIYGSVLIIFTSKFLQIADDNFGMYLPFLAFSGVCLIGLFYIILFVPETKKKTLEDIQQCLKGHK